MRFLNGIACAVSSAVKSSMALPCIQFSGSIIHYQLLAENRITRQLSYRGPVRGKAVKTAVNRHHRQQSFLAPAWSARYRPTSTHIQTGECVEFFNAEGVGLQYIGTMLFLSGRCRNIFVWQQVTDQAEVGPMRRSS